MKLKHDKNLQKLVDKMFDDYGVWVSEVLEDNAYIFIMGEELTIEDLENGMKIGIEAAKHGSDPHYLKFDYALYVYTDRTPDVIRKDLEKFEEENEEQAAKSSVEAQLKALSSNGKIKKSDVEKVLSAKDPKDEGAFERGYSDIYEFEDQGHMSINEFSAWAKSEFPNAKFERPSSDEVTFETPDGMCSGYFHKGYANGEIEGSPEHIKKFKKFLSENKKKFEKTKTTASYKKVGPWLYCTDGGAGEYYAKTTEKELDNFVDIDDGSGPAPFEVAIPESKHVVHFYKAGGDYPYDTIDIREYNKEYDTEFETIEDFLAGDMS